MADLRDLPSVDTLTTELIARADGVPRALVVDIARSAVDSARTALRAGDDNDARAVAEADLRRLMRMRHHRVINATGVLLHTNLGRAPLHPEAAAAAAAAASGYGNIEFDLNEGSRGSRGAYLTTLLREVTGARDALVVNNNAAALFLVLHTLARGGSVPVSRGELIEIGGSYRLPDLMASTGAELVEVGTTNRTRLSDYKLGLRPTTQLLLKVHPSNYRVAGFAEETTAGELTALAEEQQIPMVYDVGSGLLDAAVPWLDGPPPSWLSGEPAVRDLLAEKVDLITFSGDKLLGGPQAGILVGDGELISALRTSPVARALRIDGATIAALTTTIELYASGRGGELPFWRMVSQPVSDLEGRLEAVAHSAGLPSALEPSEAMAGAGSVPGMTVPSPVLIVRGRGDQAWPRLLATDPVVVARRVAGDLVIDIRAVDPDDDQRLADALKVACQ